VLEKGRLYHAGMPDEVRELIWTIHIEALRPLAEAGKLGCLRYYWREATLLELLFAVARAAQLARSLFRTSPVAGIFLTHSHSGFIHACCLTCLPQGGQLGNQSSQSYYQFWIFDFPKVPDH
jgi:hypothetical protein